MSYFSLYYHFVWHTKGSVPILKGDKEKQVWEIIRSTIMKSPDIFYVRLGGTSHHVHVLVYSKSTVSVAKIAQLMKGASSEIINKKRLFPFHFSWQHEYGCVTVDMRDIDVLKKYLSDQKVHHSRKTIIKHFESTDFRDFDLDHAWGNDRQE
jgi:putative transposase